MRNRAALAIVAVIIATASLHADVAIGAGTAILETSLTLGLAPAVFLIEAVVAYRIFRGRGFGIPLLAVIIANLASSIVGVFVVEVVPLDVSFRSSRRGPQTDEGMLAMMVLCIPFFALSVLIEFLVAKGVMPSKDDSRVWRWAIEANVVSYLMIEAVLLIALWTLRSARSQGLIASLW